MARKGDERTERQEVFGDRVRERRKELGLSQEAVALLSGLQRAYIGQIEQGRRNVSLDNMADVARALEIDLGDLSAGLQDMRGHRD